MNVHKLRDKVSYAIGKLKEAKYRLPIDSIEYLLILSNSRLAGGSPSCIIKIMKNIVKMLPSSVLETCYGSRLATLNGYAFVELTYKLLVSLSSHSFSQ